MDAVQDLPVPGHREQLAGRQPGQLHQPNDQLRLGVRLTLPLLGHEENDMMRTLVLAAPPEAPTLLSATSDGQSTVTVVWNDNSPTARSFTVEKAPDGSFTTGVVSNPLGKVTTWSDTACPVPGSCFYRVFTSKTVGSTVPGYSTVTAESAFSNVLGASAPGVFPPTNLTATLQTGPQVLMAWTDSANDAVYVVEKSINGGAYAQLGGILPADTVSSTDIAVSIDNAYVYRVKAVEGGA